MYKAHLPLAVCHGYDKIGLSRPGFYGTSDVPYVTERSYATSMKITLQDSYEGGRIIATSPFHGAFKFHWLHCLRFLSRHLPPLAT
jgi:hypothetical protein